MKEILDVIGNRFKSALWGYFVISFTLWNWKAWYFLFFGEWRVLQRFAYVALVTDKCTLLIFPLLSTVIGSLCYPWISLFFTWATRKPFEYLNILRLRSESKVITEKLNLERSRNQINAVREQELIDRAKRDEEVHAIEDPIQREDLERKLEELRSENEKLQDSSPDRWEKDIIELKNEIPTPVYAPHLKEDSWIYERRCLVFNYLIEGTHEISIDVYRNQGGWDIELFGRNAASANYLMKNMIGSETFLGEPLENYKYRDNRLIYAKFNSRVTVNKVAKEVIDLLQKIEDYIKSLEREKTHDPLLIRLLVGKWRNEWGGTGPGMEEALIQDDGVYYLNSNAAFRIQNLKYDQAQQLITFTKVGLRPEDKRSMPNILAVVNGDHLSGHEINGSARYPINYQRISKLKVS